MILKTEWVIEAFDRILSTRSVLHREGVLLYSELYQIWDKETYPISIYPQLLELMNKFELAYELPDESSYLVPELLPKTAPNGFEWDEKNDLCLYYCYDFLPLGTITRFIVRMNQYIEIKESGLPLCWREGAVLKLKNSRALVEMKPDGKQIEIRIKGNNKKELLGAICDQLDQINSSIKKINGRKQIPCNCSENCPERYYYEDLLKAEMNNIETIQCYNSFKNISISLLLDGYKRREERLREYYEISKELTQDFGFMKTKQKIDLNVNVNVNLEVYLPQIQSDFDKLKKEIEYLNPKLESDLNKIQDSLDEISTNHATEKLIKPLNKLNRFLDKLNDPDSDYNEAMKGTQKGIEYAQKLGRTYNKFAQWLAMPTVPELFLGK
ncbi:MAG: hypothetical protein NHB15_10570 [Methanosarcina barkeri]|nr:hypothetical protein [Methanosarcina sp. ERenArc_MAG2]